MKHYEILCVLPGTLSEDEVKGVTDKVFAVLEKEGATNALVEDMGKSRLAYPIKHIRYGYFRLFRLEAEGKTITAVQEKLRLMTELLRAVVQAYDPAKVSDKKINYVAGGTISSISREKTTSRDRKEVRREDREVPKAETVEEKVEEKKVEVPVIEVKEDAPVEEKVEEKKEEVKPKAKKKDELNLDDINKKLDNILSEDIADV